MMRRSSRTVLILSSLLLLSCGRSRAVEIPLDTISPLRIGYIDLQRVFDTYPEKSFAEGDLLREIEKRKRELGRRQNEIGTLREQIAADDSALVKARTGQPVLVPFNNIPEPEPTKPAAAAATPPASSTSTVRTSSATAVEPYPTEDPLAGLPGHTDIASTLLPTPPTLPGIKPSPAKPVPTLLDLLAGATAPVVLQADAISALENRIQKNRRALDRATTSFKSFRTNAVGDMKQLQTEKTYGVMSKIYAVLQTLARDENITVVIDKAYILYGEETVDLSDKLISRLQAEAM
ncbi:MAG: OmpH family outer membrane protein [Elusimicrobiota bacterium]|jgi:Skp family chaperone for outer membrane proteins